MQNTVSGIHTRFLAGSNSESDPLAVKIWTVLLLSCDTVGGLPVFGTRTISIDRVQYRADKSLRNGGSDFKLPVVTFQKTTEHFVYRLQFRCHMNESAKLLYNQYAHF
jgi:hypothetical protein